MTEQTKEKFEEIDFNWSEIKTKHQSVARTLAENALRIKALMTNKKLEDYRDDPVYLRVISGGEYLVTTLADTLGKMYRQHKDKSGKLHCSDDYNLALKLTSQYEVFESDMLIALGSTMEALINLAKTLDQDGALYEEDTDAVNPKHIIEGVK